MVDTVYRLRPKRFTYSIQPGTAGGLVGQIRDEWRGHWYRTKREHTDKKALTRHLRDVCRGMEKGFALNPTMEEVLD